ncbi:hypothetical protein TRFO_31876 [Tritrichomonas foetus]|uniref:Uncharacterized protein n=1 Tax=Tritrichomonas foetus TaxID=1144522 RepID=A0A1J4JVK2_9EUKA|nr:hypothetical protein TRFO_31876 [Tritrichomonas foetus]|eukprot:OHT01301.1 hypothetical protein TRFO_31876 [Tritrichomonas foetus]
MEFDLQKFLEDPNSSYSDLLKCTEVSSLLMTNKEFQTKFLSTNFLKNLFDFLSRTDDFSVHKHFISLAQTLNPLLGARFSEDILLTESAFSIIDSQSNQSASYAFGSLSRYLFYATHNFPAEMQEVFNLSKKIYLIMIRNIDKLSLLIFISDLITDKNIKLDYFLWLCFKLISGKDKKFSPSPLCQYLRTPIECFDNPEDMDKLYKSLTKVHITNIINTLTLFFQNNEGSEIVFATHVAKYIASQKKIKGILFDLASSIPATNEIAQKAFESVISQKNRERSQNKLIEYESNQHSATSSTTDQKTTNLNEIPFKSNNSNDDKKNDKKVGNEYGSGNDVDLNDDFYYLSDRAANYLLKCHKILSKDTLEYAILYMLTSGTATNQALGCLPKLVKAAAEDGSSNEMKNILAYAWNSCDDLHLVKPFIIKCATKIKSIQNVMWPEGFIREVITPWASDDDVNFEFKFEQSGIDFDFIDFLKHLFETKK